MVGVLLDAAGEKAFCAGGDLRQLYQTLRDCGPERNAYAERFFGEEYELDHLIHTFPKPFLCWGHGIVMGGGVGLLARRLASRGTRRAASPCPRSTSACTPTSAAAGSCAACRAGSGCSWR